MFQPPIAMTLLDTYIEVSGDAFVDGIYNIFGEQSSGPSRKLVYKHQDKDFFIYLDPIEGWKLGDQYSMNHMEILDGSFYKSKLKTIPIKHA